eukprot:2645102-Prymnesium_polylepis.1
MWRSCVRSACSTSADAGFAAVAVAVAVAVAMAGGAAREALACARQRRCGLWRPWAWWGLRRRRLARRMALEPGRRLSRRPRHAAACRRR